MTTTTLGKTDIVIPPVGIGTWAWGDRLFWNYGGEYGAHEVEAAFNAAVAAGVNFFDTAEVYGLGESETLLGQFIKNSDQEILIATKYGPAPWRWTHQSVTDAVSGSLRRLGVEQIQLYQVHWPFSFFMSQETLMNALADEVERGRIASIGVSNYSTEQMQEAYELLAKRGVPLAVNQVQYSLAHRKIESNGILSTARELGVSILAYSPLAQGLLTGKYTNSNSPAGARKFDSRFGQAGLQKFAPLLDLLEQLAQKYEKTMAQVALNWLIAQPHVIPIPGAKNARQARQNAGAAGWSLDEAELERLEQVSRPWLQ